LLLAFFHISTTDSHATDEQLKVDINAVRTALTHSGYKIRFAAIVLSDKSILHAPELEERLSSIRRLTSLDSKTGLFFMPPMNSAAEIATFVHSVMVSTLQPLVVEYYRDLTKHARRKKTKGSPPAPSITSPTAAAAGTAALSTVGWNARYEIKQAIFAEFRQEMDVAERQYSSSLEELFSSEGVFETTPSWSPRWEEARLLADSLALRRLRCLLWSERTTAAVQCWTNYQTKMRDLIDRRGKGSGTYGWAAWEATWAQIMAELVKGAGLLPAPDRKSLSNETTPDADVVEERQPAQVFAVPEKSAATATERLHPWRNLHHAGYWYRLAVRGSRERQRRVQEVPEEDRKSLGAESKSGNYDTYLTGHPNEEYDSRDEFVASQTGPLTEIAMTEFESRGQERMSEVMKLELARDFIEIGLHSDALGILVSLWEQSSWRDEDWHDLFVDLLLLLRESAQKEGRHDVVVATTYELISPSTQALTNAPRNHLDLMKCLEGISSTSDAVDLKFNGRKRLSPVAISVAFENKETHVGEAIGCQLTIQARLGETVAPVTLSRVSLRVGNSRTVLITHSVESGSENEESVDLSNVSESPGGLLETKADLTLRPYQRRIYNFSLTFREAESFSIKSASTCIEANRFKIEHLFQDEEVLQSDSIFVRSGDVLEKKPLPHVDTGTVRVLPKPPKIRILVHGLRKQYYTDELVRLGVEVVNGEADVVSGDVSARTEALLPLRWIPAGAKEIHEDSPSSELVIRNIENLEPTDAHKEILGFKAPQDPAKSTIALEVKYNLSSDDNTQLSKTLTLDLHFVNSFEVKFSFGPLLYSDSWPSYFDRQLRSSAENPGGIPQRWRLSTHIRSLATDSITLHEILPVVNNVIGDSAASVADRESTDKEPFGPGDIERASFEIHTQKLLLDDRRPTTVQSTLEITWARDENSSTVTTRVPVPSLTLPVSEPRVLCTLNEGATPNKEEDESLWDATLNYHIENPSTHFLTFALTMEATEEFAFSGPKYRTLSLAPLSRHKVEYRLSMQDQLDGGGALASQVDTAEDGPGRWIWPSLQVIDSYYQKTLRVHPGSEGVKFDEKQNIAVFIKDR
jgi:hypothetical protein